MLDKKFASIIGGRLLRFKWINDNTALFRCPYCGDSKKNKYKTRGYLYESDSGLSFFCQNCSVSKFFSQFLKDQDENLFKEYIFEKFRNGKGKDQPKKAKNNDRIPLDSLTPLVDLPPSHPAMKYALERQIPEDMFNKLYYTDNYKKWVDDNVIKGKYEKLPEKDERLVIPFLDKNKEAFAMQGRALSTDPNVIRYITAKKSDDLLIYGLDRVDLTKEIFLLEGPIDSMFIDNALAAAGSSLKRMFDSHLDLIFVFDNEPRSPEIVGLMGDVIKKGKKIVIFPDSLKDKDINLMILNNPSIDINKLLKDNVYMGLKARLKFDKWRKI